MKTGFLAVLGEHMLMTFDLRPKLNSFFFAFHFFESLAEGVFADALAFLGVLL